MADHIVLPTVRPIRDRIDFLLGKLWNRNQSTMARDLGLNQSTISTVLSGKREPGAKLIQALSAHPAINARWLVEGTGSPFADDRSLSMTVPVSRGLLGESPVLATAKLSGRRENVAPANARPSVYAAPAGSCAWSTTRDQQHVLDDDLLFIDTDQSIWQSALSVLNGRLCVIRLTAEQGQSLVLARVFSDGRDLWTGSAKCQAIDEQMRAEKNDYGKYRPPIVLGDEQSKEDYGLHHPFGIVDVVGLVLHLQRNL